MTSLKLAKGSLPKLVVVPSSKSYANRALILGALKESSFTVSNLPGSTDVSWLIKALEQCCLRIQKHENSVTVIGSFPECEKMGGTIEVGDGGTTARFFASMLLRGKKPYILKLAGRLKDRPWSEFISFVRTYGGHAELVNDELHLQGPLKLPAKVEVDCARTTQFASGLLLAFWDLCEVVPYNLSASISYWEMTEALLESAKHVNHFKVPFDWSSASYPLAFGALNHEIFFPGLKDDPYQSDAKFLKILKELDAIQVEEEGIRVFPIKEHRSISLNVSDCLDLVPALVFLLAHLEGEHRLKGVGNLVHKESDRLSGLMKLLDQFGRTNSYQGDEMIFEGSSVLLDNPVSLNMADDHRMVMTAALFLRHHQGGEVGPREAVAKSYPHFFEIFS